MAAPQVSSARAPRLASFSTTTGRLEPGAGLRRGVDSGPARQDRRVPDGAGHAIDRRRQPHDRSDHPAALDPGLPEHLVDELGRLGEAFARGLIDVELAPALGEDGVGEVGYCDPQVAVAEVDGERQAGGGVEGDHDAGAARRGPRHPAGRPARRRGPTSIRSPTIVEIVERERSVARASSARLATPRSLQRFDHKPAVAFPQGGE